MTRGDGRAPGSVPKPKPERPEQVVARDRALGVIAGLMVFGLGFAVAACFEIAVLVTGSGSLSKATYFVGIGGALIGLIVIAWFMTRPSPLDIKGALWAPAGLRVLARSAGLPPLGTLIVVYAIIIFGLFGNMIIPIFFTLKK